MPCCLLALRNGLRCVDIVNLKLGDISVEKQYYRSRAVQNRCPACAALLTRCRERIADYIMNGRPDSQQPYIFSAYPGRLIENWQAILLAIRSVAR